MRKIKLLKFKEVDENVFVAVASESALKTLLSKEEWEIIKNWKEIVLMENIHFVINKFIPAIKYEKKLQRFYY